MHDQTGFAEPTATDLLIQISVMRGMIQGYVIRQEAQATVPALIPAQS